MDLREDQACPMTRLSFSTTGRTKQILNSLHCMAEVADRSMAASCSVAGQTVDEPNVDRDLSQQRDDKRVVVALPQKAARDGTRQHEVTRFVGSSSRPQLSTRWQPTHGTRAERERETAPVSRCSCRSRRWRSSVVPAQSFRPEQIGGAAHCQSVCCDAPAMAPSEESNTRG